MSDGFRTTANKRTRYTADDCKDPGLPTPQPQQEYIITEDKIQGIETAMSKWMLPDAGKSLGKLLRSRPAPSAPATIIGKQTYEAFENAKFPVFVQGTGWISKFDAERMFAATAARSAREDFADKVIAFCKSNDCVQSTYGDCDCVATTDNECIICFIESLRTQQQAGDPR